MRAIDNKADGSRRLNMATLLANNQKFAHVVPALPEYEKDKDTMWWTWPTNFGTGRIPEKFPYWWTNGECKEVHVI